MSSALHLNTSAPSSARLRRERVADGVVAGYIRELSRPARVATDSTPRPGRSRTAVRAAASRVRAEGRRRSHAVGAWRPLAAPAGCPAA
jgi:hypothetical protein